MHEEYSQEAYDEQDAIAHANDPVVQYERYLRYCAERDGVTLTEEQVQHFIMKEAIRLSFKGEI